MAKDFIYPGDPEWPSGEDENWNDHPKLKKWEGVYPQAYGSNRAAKGGPHDGERRRAVKPFMGPRVQADDVDMELYRELRDKTGKKLYDEHMIDHAGDDQQTFLNYMAVCNKLIEGSLLPLDGQAVQRDTPKTKRTIPRQ